MLRPGMFRHLFVGFGFLIVFSVGLLAFLVAGQTEKNELQNLEERLLNEALLVRQLVRNQDPAAPEVVAILRELPRNSETRLTFIAPSGEVLAESARDRDSLENHADRLEVQKALDTGQGRAIRHSQTLREDMMYVAIRAQRPSGEPYIVRIAVPLTGLQDRIRTLQRLVGAAATLTGLLSLGLVYWLARRSARPLEELIHGAEEIAAGNYGHRVYVDGSSEVSVLARTFNHMSERLETQFSQIDEDRQQLRTVLSSMVEGVIAIDPEQRILFANDRAGQMLEFSPRAAVGRRLWELIRQRQLQELIQSALAQDPTHSRSVSLNLAGGRSLLVQVARLPGVPSRGAVLVFHDNTELRRLERLRQEFVANVSHELKTPLAIIAACVETLIDGGCDDTTIRVPFLQRIADQSERLHNLILDLLRLARIESETEAFSMEEVELGEVVEQSLERHRALARNKQQTLESIPPPEGQQTRIWVDQEAAELILNNLVDNALKYTPQGGRITVRWGREEDRVVLEVTDTGIGIPESELSRVFERFYRVDKARSRELGGTGLGLSIVKHLVQAMQGTVSARSREGVGTTFMIHFPALTPTSPAIR